MDWHPRVSQAWDTFFEAWMGPNSFRGVITGPRFSRPGGVSTHSESDGQERVTCDDERSCEKLPYEILKILWIGRLKENVF
jgi:hypothetical protein